MTQIYGLKNSYDHKKKTELEKKWKKKRFMEKKTTLDDFINII